MKQYFLVSIEKTKRSKGLVSMRTALILMVSKLKDVKKNVGSARVIELKSDQIIKKVHGGRMYRGRCECAIRARCVDCGMRYHYKMGGG